jgi:hypothetical protein
MIHKSFASIAALTLLSTVAHAGSAPKELYGKSISVAWTETRTQKDKSDQSVRNSASSVQMNIYISTAGRPFVRVNTSGIGGGHNLHDQWINHPTSLTEAAPGEAAADHVVFEGRSIVAYQQFRSGARRIAVDVEGTACKATIVHGREGSKNIQKNLASGREVEVLSIQAGAVSCSIQEGNVFGQ